MKKSVTVTWQVGFFNFTHVGGEDSIIVYQSSGTRLDWGKLIKLRDAISEVITHLEKEGCVVERVPICSCDVDQANPNCLVHTRRALAPIEEKPAEVLHPNDICIRCNRKAAGFEPDQAPNKPFGLPVCGKYPYCEAD